MVTLLSRSAGPAWVLVYPAYKMISASMVPEWHYKSFTSVLENHPFISAFNFIFIELGSIKLKFFTFSLYF